MRAASVHMMLRKLPRNRTRLGPQLLMKKWHEKGRVTEQGFPRSCHFLHSALPLRRLARRDGIYAMPGALPLFLITPTTPQAQLAQVRPTRTFMNVRRVGSTVR